MNKLHTELGLVKHGFLPINLSSMNFTETILILNPFAPIYFSVRK